MTTIFDQLRDAMPGLEHMAKTKYNHFEGRPISELEAGWFLGFVDASKAVLAWIDGENPWKTLGVSPEVMLDHLKTIEAPVLDLYESDDAVKARLKEIYDESD